MQLSELRASSRRLIGVHITSTEYSDTNLDASLNEWYKTIIGWVIRKSDKWNPRGITSTTDLVSGQVEYVLPSADLIQLKRVEIKYNSSDTYKSLDEIIDKAETGAFANDSINHQGYRLLNDSIFIYPAPTSDVTNGLSIEYVENITELTNDTDVPKLNPLVHRAVAIGGAMDYCRSEEMWKKYRELEAEMFGHLGGSREDSLKSQIEALSAMRDQSQKIRIKPRFTSFK